METIFENLIQRPRHITLLALNLRMSREERDAVRAARLTDGDVDDAMFLMSTARYIDLEHPVTIAGITMLETKGLLGVGRANQILSAEVQTNELAPA